MFDVEFPLSLVNLLPEEDRDILFTHSEYIEDLGVFRLGNDGDMFMNHSDEPSLIDCGIEMRTAYDLPAGSELTCDYSQVRVLGFGVVTDLDKGSCAA